MTLHDLPPRDDNPPERHWYVFPVFRAAALIGIMAGVLGSVKCYQEFVKPALQQPEQKKTLEEKVEFKTLYKKQTMLPYSHDQIRSPHGRIITNETELQELYSQTNFDFSQIDGEFVPILPDYKPDFTKEMVIAVFQGQRPTTGYDIELISIVETEHKLLITSTIIEPSGGLAGAVITHPGHYVVCKKIENKPVIHFDYKMVNPFQKAYLLMPATDDIYNDAGENSEPGKSSDRLAEKSRQWHKQFKDDCTKSGIPIPEKLHEDKYQTIPMIDMNLEPDQAEQLRKAGYKVYKY